MFDVCVSECWRFDKFPARWTQLWSAGLQWAEQQQRPVIRASQLRHEGSSHQPPLRHGQTPAPTSILSRPALEVSQPLPRPASSQSSGDPSQVRNARYWVEYLESSSNFSLTLQAGCLQIPGPGAEMMLSSSFNIVRRSLILRRLTWTSSRWMVSGIYW